VLSARVLYFRIYRDRCSHACRAAVQYLIMTVPRSHFKEHFS
jgi:hypothetical protein